MIVRYQDALCALDLLLGWRDPWIPLSRAYAGRGGAVRRPCWHHAGSPRALVELVRLSDELQSAEVHIGCAEPRRGGGPMGAPVLWVRVEGPEQLKRARRFRPLPTMAVQEGSSTRRWLLWGLREWLPYFDVEQMNKRIAYRLGAVQKHGSPERLWLPAPGSVLSVDRGRPVPVVCRRLVPAVFTARQVAGRLKDPPAPTWMERAG